MLLDHPNFAYFSMLGRLNEECWIMQTQRYGKNKTGLSASLQI